MAEPERSWDRVNRWEPGYETKMADKECRARYRRAGSNSGNNRKKERLARLFCGFAARGGSKRKSYTPHT